MYKHLLVFGCMVVTPEGRFSPDMFFGGFIFQELKFCFGVYFECVSISLHFITIGTVGQSFSNSYTSVELSLKRVCLPMDQAIVKTVSLTKPSSILTIHLCHYIILGYTFITWCWHWYYFHFRKCTRAKCNKILTNISFDVSYWVKIQCWYQRRP